MWRSWTRCDENARKHCSTIIIDVVFCAVVVGIPHILHSKQQTNSRNSSSKIDVDNYDNLQTLYTNIQISFIHYLRMTHPQAKHQHQPVILQNICSLLLLFNFFHCCCLDTIVSLFVCIAVQFPVFYSFLRARTLTHALTYNFIVYDD